MKNVGVVNPIKDMGIYTGHNLYSGVLSAEFVQIRAFQLSNPGEIVIIDLNGEWWEMDDFQYEQLEFRLNLV